MKLKTILNELAQIEYSTAKDAIITTIQKSFELNPKLKEMFGIEDQIYDIEVTALRNQTRTSSKILEAMDISIEESSLSCAIIFPRDFLSPPVAGIMRLMISRV